MDVRYPMIETGHFLFERYHSVLGSPRLFLKHTPSKCYLLPWEEAKFSMYQTTNPKFDQLKLNHQGEQPFFCLEHYFSSRKSLQKIGWRCAKKISLPRKENVFWFGSPTNWVICNSDVSKEFPFWVGIFSSEPRRFVLEGTDCYMAPEMLASSRCREVIDAIDGSEIRLTTWDVF